MLFTTQTSSELAKLRIVLTRGQINDPSKTRRSAVTIITIALSGIAIKLESIKYVGTNPK